MSWRKADRQCGGLGFESKAMYLVERNVFEPRGFVFNGSWKITEEDRTYEREGISTARLTSKVRLSALTLQGLAVTLEL
jgi:hypothetical protein